MPFRDKINTLISLFRINNVTLARGIGADPSLVSRWRTGDRVPAKYDRTLREIAAFLAGAPMLPLDRRQLEELTGRSCEGRDDREAAVYDWLRRDDGADSGAPPARAADLTGILAEFLVREQPVSGAPLNLWPHVQKGIPAEHEVFFGNKGRRQAVINFMRNIQAAPRPGDVWLSGWANPAWFDGLEEFGELWLRCLQMLLQNGHHLHLLTPPVASFTDFAALLKLPLHHIGRCTLYTAPEPDAVLLMAGTGAGAVVSYPGGGDITLYFKTQHDSAFYENVLSRAFSRASALFEVCDGEPGPVERSLALAESGEGDFFVSRSSLGVQHIPREAVAALLEGALPPDEARRRMELVERRAQAQEHVLRLHRCVEFIPGPVLDAVALNGACRISGAQLMLDGDAALSGGTLRRTLQNILDLLRHRHRFHIATSDDPPLPLSISYRAQTGALFSSDRVSGRPRFVFMGASPMLPGLEQWFSDRILPRDEAIRRLEDAIAGI